MNRNNGTMESLTDTKSNTENQADGDRNVNKNSTKPLSANKTDSTGGLVQKNQVPDYLRAIGMDPRKFWPKKYRFTREKSPGAHNPLTIAQRNFYETNGYIVLDDAAPSKLLGAIKTKYRQSELVDEFLVQKLVARNGKLLQYVKCFCDERSMLMTYRLIESFQSKDSAKALMDNEQNNSQHLFRDLLYLPFRPIDKVVCAITAIEPVEHVILVVPGTHRVGQCSISSTMENISASYEVSQEKPPRKPLARELYEAAPEKLSSLIEKSKKGFRYVNLGEGQTLFYHPGLIHGFSNDLINFRKRQLATVAYYAAADCEFVNLRQSLGSENLTTPISLAHFEGNPRDYRAWLDKPILLNDTKAGL